MSNSQSDAIFNGRMVLDQPAQGYRFSIDSLLLVEFARSNKASRLAFDLGAGCGVVGLGLLAAGFADRVIAVEIQEGLAALASSNGVQNGFAQRYEVVCADVRRASQELPEGSADLVVSNPPFWPVWRERMPTDRERKIARHEVHGGLVDWIRAAKRLLHPRRGRFLVVYPARRLDELLHHMCSQGLSGTRMRLVFPTPSRPAEQVLIEARGGKPGRLEVLPPLLLKDETGADSPDLQRIASGEFSAKLKERPDKRTVRG